MTGPAPSGPGHFISMPCFRSKGGLPGSFFRPALISLGIGLILSFAVSCARPPMPVEKPPAVSFDVSGLKDRSAFWDNYQGKFRLRVDSQTSKFSSRAIIFVRGRDFIRFETFTTFGQTAALYVSNDSGPALLIPSQKALFSAQRPETLVREFLGVTLPVDVFRYVLAASVPPEQLDHIEGRFDAGAWRLAWNGGDGSYFEWQVAGNPPALKSVFIRSGGFEGRVSYDPPVPLSKEAVPNRITISSSNWSMEVLVEELKPASQFQPSVFKLPALPDIRKVDLDTIK